MTALLSRFFPKAPLALALGLAPAPQLEPLAMTEIPAGQRVEGSRLGGLSALSWGKDRSLFLSDDRGKFGPPRFYEARVDFDGKNLNVSAWKMKTLRKIPLSQGRPPAVDPEGLARWSGGEILISSEADTNLKPRAQNRLFRFSAEGLWKGETVLPADLQPELTGRQKRGSRNNLGPEGLSLSPDGNFLWLAIEAPLVQETREGSLRFERFHLKDGDFRTELTRSYEVSKSPEGSGEIFRGVSSVLALSETRLFVLERSAILDSRGITYGGGIFLADCAKEPCEKKPVLDFARDLAGFRKGKNIPNFEGLSWGPPRPGGGKTIFLLSDDNFSVKSGAELILFAVKDSHVEHLETEKRR